MRADFNKFIESLVYWAKGDSFSFGIFVISLIILFYLIIFQPTMEHLSPNNILTLILLVYIISNLNASQINRLNKKVEK